MENKDSISLNKYISERGICSRREADELIRSGRVTINNEPTRPGNRVGPNDIVRIDNRLIGQKPKTIYIAFNKPIGIECTTNLSVKKNIISYINYRERLFPIGRLDKPSQGLIFLTNDGDIVNKILRAGNNHEKEYIVTVDRPFTDEFMTKMEKGVPILGTVTKRCKMERLGKRAFKITLVQGLNRQIRRMCEHFGYEVNKLKRVRIMNVALGDLEVGKYRNLTKKEISGILNLVDSSSNASAASRDDHRKTGFSRRKKR